MLLSLGHGQRILKLTEATFAKLALTGTAIATPGPDQESAIHVLAAGPAEHKGEGRFGYLFPSAAGHGRPIDSAVLDLLADAMIDQGSKPDIQAIAPVFTYFGQFIDHDITAHEDASSLLGIDKGVLAPVARDLVVAQATNRRDATLRLDSLYGDGPGASVLEDAMRDGARMRVGGNLQILNPPITPPDDLQGDLPRVGPLVQAGVLAAADVPAELQTGGTADQSRAALIGDARNDENLIVAQLHLAFLRFHNAVVDRMPAGDAVATFEKARAIVRRTYQWLVVNAYLPAVCDAAVLQQVIDEGAPIYKVFAEARLDELKPGELPMPLEFSVAAFRYGHTLIRARYDYNRVFTGANAATFEQLFAFTGRSKPSPIGAPFVGSVGLPTLPDNWPIDWSRFLGRAGDPGFRFARAIDTALVPPLANMVNEADGVFRNLARRNLRRGWVNNLPTAQGLIAALADAGHPVPVVLTPDQITSGPIADSALPADVKAEFAVKTPLWFYVLKEAELLNGGARLGPLGTRIVAETLVGLAVNDAGSYWHLGAGNGGWSPRDETDVTFDEPITSMEAMLRAAGVLA